MGRDSPSNLRFLQSIGIELDGPDQWALDGDFEGLFGPSLIGLVETFGVTVQGNSSAALLAIEPKDFDDQLLVTIGRWRSLYDRFLRRILKGYWEGFLDRKAGFAAERQR